MKFPLSLDLRKKTLALGEDCIRVIDTDYLHVASVMPMSTDDAGTVAGRIVGTLNAIHDRSPVKIRDISVEVYKKMLDRGDLERMLAKDDDGGKKLRSRAGIYDNAVRATLEVLSKA